jgi:hypothetical protein
VKVLRWLSEPVLVVGSFLVVLGVIALVNGGSFRAAATLSGDGEPIAERAEAIPAASALAGAPSSTLAFVRSDHRSGEPEPALGIVFDDAWLLLVAGAGVLCIGKGLRLVTESGPRSPSLRSA